MKLAAADLADIGDPAAWLNKRIEQDSASLDSLETYLSALQLSLTLLAQDCADSDDILSGQYLAQMPSLSTDVEKMLDESAAATARLRDLEKNGIHKNPEISRIISAIEKVEISRKSISRGKKRIF